MTAYLDPEREIFGQFRSMQRDGPVHMLNLVRLRDKARYSYCREVTGAEAYAAYGRESAPIFHAVGGRIVWRGSFELMLIGPQDAEQWDLCFIAEYPSVDAFVSMVKNPDYQKAVIHRQAAVEDSRLIRTFPKGDANSFG